MRYLCGRPSELKYDHKGDKIDQLGRLVGMRATYAAKEDEREGSDDAKRTNQVPALALSVPEMADGDGCYKILMYVQSGAAKVSLCFVLILCASSGNQWGCTEAAVAGGTSLKELNKIWRHFCSPAL